MRPGFLPRQFVEGDGGGVNRDQHLTHRRLPHRGLLDFQYFRAAASVRTQCGHLAHQKPFAANQFSATSATSRQPLSIVSEWPRPGNSWNSVSEAPLAYIPKTSLVTFNGTVWSSVPDVSNSGPRSARWVSTLAGEFFEKLAVASWNRGRPGPGMVHLSCRASDSSSESMLPKA